MMKTNVRTLILSILALLPVASIATAAESALSESEGQIRNDRMRAEIARARRTLFPQGNRSVTIADAWNRVRSALLGRSVAGAVSDSAVDEEMRRTVGILYENGMIQVDEKRITSLVESFGGGK